MAIMEIMVGLLLALWVLVMGLYMRDLNYRLKKIEEFRRAMPTGFGPQALDHILGRLRAAEVTLKRIDTLTDRISQNQKKIPIQNRATYSGFRADRIKEFEESPIVQKQQ